MADPKDQPVDFDDLLALTDDEEQATPEAPSDDPEPEAEEPEAPAPTSDPGETPEQKRIRELEAALAAPLPEGIDEEETPAQKRIKELEDQLARRNTMILDRAPETFVADSGPGEKILIHFLEDGFTAFGQVWSKGQEIEVVVGSENWKRTLNRSGTSWLDRRNDPTAQRLRYGKIMFAEGPYKWRSGEEFDVTVAQADVRRGRRVPAPTAV